MTKNIIIGVLAAGVIVLLYLLLHEPKLVDSHKAEHDRILADNKAFAAREPGMLKTIDSLEASGKSKDSVIASLKVDKKVTQKQADKYAAEATRLAKEVKELRDTSEVGRKCDSLADAAENFAFLYNQYKAYSDSLTDKLEQQSDDYLHGLDEQRKLYSELKAKYDGLMKAYADLFADLGKLQKTVKRERLKTKIAALLALVAGGAAVLK
jgi:uncharacterized coiled-coil DUF342 family protein